MDSYYLDERVASLAGVPFFATRIGPGYDRIPTSELYHGFSTAFDDRRQEHASYDPYQYRNTPQLRASMYEGNRDDGVPMLGFYTWEPERITLDMAPDFVKSRVPQLHQIGNCLNSLRQQPCPTVLNSGVLVGHAGKRQRDAGNPIGVLFDPPALGPIKSGQLYSVPSFLSNQ